jgi:transposase-like protein
MRKTGQVSSFKMAVKRRTDEKTPRRNQTAAFKTNVALAAIKGEKTLVELAEQFTFIPTRLRSGRASLRRALRACSVRPERTKRRRLTSMRCMPRSAN